MKNIAFIGVGVMGNGMVSNLLKAGFSVKVYSRRKESAERALAAGAVWCDSIAECTADADAVITMVGFPADVEEVYFGEKGIIANAPAGSVMIDMTTTSPSLSRRIYEEGRAKGLEALDAPVSGGEKGAWAGTLAIMVGGDEKTFEKCAVIFEALGSQVRLMGGAGAGQHTKMANQIAIAGAVAGACEAISYCRKTGIDPEEMLKAIGGGAAGSWQLSNHAPLMLKEDYSAGFYLKHYVKDMSIAENEVGHDTLPVLSKVLDMYKELEARGFAENGIQSIIEYYKD